MPTLDEIERIVAELWDRQIETDVSEGKLDRFAAEALAEHERGETRDL